jgi:hypothetical protein
MLAGRAMEVTRASLILRVAPADARFRATASLVGTLRQARVSDVSDLAAPSSADVIFEVVVEGLLAVDLPDAGDDTVRTVAAAAAAHAAGMPDLTRVGVRLVGALVVAVCLVPAGGHLARLPARRRGRLLTRVGRLPVVGEYVRLARGVGLVCYYDRAARDR